MDKIKEYETICDLYADGKRQRVYSIICQMSNTKIVDLIRYCCDQIEANICANPRACVVYRYIRHKALNKIDNYKF